MKSWLGQSGISQFLHILGDWTAISQCEKSKNQQKNVSQNGTDHSKKSIWSQGAFNKLEDIPPLFLMQIISLKNVLSREGGVSVKCLHSAADFIMIASWALLSE